MPGPWEYNPPPNWPADDSPGLDWRPDPEWGPLPVGWPLWRRRRRPILRRRHLRSLSMLVTAALAALMAGALQGEAATRPEPAVRPAAPAASTGR